MANHKADQTIFRVHRRVNFAIVNKEILVNRSLSYKAKGIMAYLLSLPPDWTVNVTNIINQSTDQEFAIRSGLKELIDAGYIVRRAERDDKGRVVRWVMEVHEEPVGRPEAQETPLGGEEIDANEKCPDRGFPHLDNPDVGKPDVENLEHTKEELTKQGPDQEKTEKNIPAAAEVKLTSGAQNFSAAAGLDFSSQTPEKRQKPDPDPNHWTLRELVRANTINRKKLDELERAGTDPRALAQWLVEAHRKTGLTNPIGYAVQNAIAYPEGKNLRDSVFAHRPKADLLAWLAKAIAGYPLSQGAPDIAALLRGISQPNLRSLYFALGGDENDIPAAYVPPTPKPRPAAPAAEETVEVPAAVLARAESFRARRQK